QIVKPKSVFMDDSGTPAIREHVGADTEVFDNPRRWAAQGADARAGIEVPEMDIGARVDGDRLRAAMHETDALDAGAPLPIAKLAAGIALPQAYAFRRSGEELPAIGRKGGGGVAVEAVDDLARRQASQHYLGTLAIRRPRLHQDF